MELDVAQRAHLASRLLTTLCDSVPGSDAHLRGSLADGRADAYSDIDLLWDVRDDDFSSAIADLPTTLARVRPVASLRFDPDFQHLAKRRLAFVRFAGVPLFWRVDLDIFARSAGRDPDYDRDNPSASGGDWSVAESALMTIVAAIKAHRRGRDATAVELVHRAERRVGMHATEGGMHRQITTLVDTIARQDPTAAPLAAEIRQLLATLK